VALSPYDRGLVAADGYVPPCRVLWRNQQRMFQVTANRVYDTATYESWSPKFLALFFTAFDEASRTVERAGGVG